MAAVERAAMGAGASAEIHLPTEADPAGALASADEGEEVPADVSVAVAAAGIRVGETDA
ncbi:MAG: hypothetical protein QOG54_29 [Actinomycetota bacterium]|nr:hypothetical protein [Actinomycetota bacterium]